MAPSEKSEEIILLTRNKPEMLDGKESTDSVIMHRQSSWLQQQGLTYTSNGLWGFADPYSNTLLVIDLSQPQVSLKFSLNE